MGFLGVEISGAFGGVGDGIRELGVAVRFIVFLGVDVQGFGVVSQVYTEVLFPSNRDEISKESQAAVCLTMLPTIHSLRTSSNSTTTLCPMPS